MNVGELQTILAKVPSAHQVYVLDSVHRRNIIIVNTVEIEYPGDDEGEVCINICLQEEEEEQA